MNITQTALLITRDLILDSLFPYTCIECGIEGEILCKTCLTLLKKLSKQYCIECGKENILGLTHTTCTLVDSADQLISMFPYSQVKNSISWGKFRGINKIFPLFGTLLANFINDFKISDLENYSVTYIPLAKGKLNQRGYNQSELLAHSFARNQNLMCIESLIRKTHLFDQKKLNTSQRKNNIINSFQINPNTVLPEHIILIDDITTSGATLQEATKVLKQNGAKKVVCLSVGRG